MPRHVYDVRPVVFDEGESESEEGLDAEPAVAQEPRYPQRERQPPVWLADYET